MVGRVQVYVGSASKKAGGARCTSSAQHRNFDASAVSRQLLCWRSLIGVRQVWCCPKCESELHLVGFERPGIDSKCHVCGLQIVHYDGFPCFAPEMLDRTEGFDPALFEMLARIEETNFWFVNRARLIVDLM